MTTYPDAFSTGKATLYLDVSESSTNAGANTSVVSFALRVVGNNASYNFNSGSTWSVNINGTVYSGTWTYDFRADNTRTLKSGTQTVTHDTNGSKTISVSGTAYGLSTIGTGTVTAQSFPLTDFTRVPSTPAISVSRDGNATGLSASLSGSAFYGSGAAYQWFFHYDGGGWNGPYSSGQGVGVDRYQKLYVLGRAIDSEGQTDADGGWWYAAPAAPTISVSRVNRNVTVTVVGAPWNAYAAGGVGSYRYEYKLDGGSWVDNGNNGSFTNLNPGATYFFRVRGVGASYWGDYSSELSVFVPSGGKRFTSSGWVPTVTAKRWDGSQWVILGTAKRWNGSIWTPLS